jgi:type II secretory pathway component PulF
VVPALGILIAFYLLVISPGARRSVICRVPIVGPVWRWTALAEFCHLLGLLLESEVPLIEAVPMAGQAVVDADIQSAARAMADELAAGLSLARVMARRSLFPAGVHPIVAWAEDHHSLAETLHMLGEMFEARARSQASFASTVCTSLTVLIILFGVGAVVLGVFVPLYQTIQKLSG